MGNILVGTCSWTDPTLLNSGGFYPATATNAESRLRFYSTQFPLVEVDSSYYGIPAIQTAGLWANRTPDGFTFDVKAFRLFTQHPTPQVVLPRDIRNELPASVRGKANVYLSELPPELVDQLWSRFDESLLPLDSAGKLGFVLFQFPSWFVFGRERREYISACKSRFRQYRIAVEFRSASWFKDGNAEVTLRFLKDHDIPLVCVDEPQGFSSSVPPMAVLTSDVAIVRFHGRNSSMWEKKGIATVERFNYLYNESELQEWVPRITKMAEGAREVHVLFNNCYEDKAVRNARRMKQIIDLFGTASADLI